MQPSSREMQGPKNQHSQQIQSPHFDPSSSSNDDFLEQMLSTCSWADLKSPCWDLNPADATTTGLSLPIHNGAAKLPVDLSKETAAENDFAFHNFDESALLASKLRLHQISGGVAGTDGGPSPVAAAKMMLQQQLMMAARGGLQSQNDVVDGSSFNSTPSQGEPKGSMQALYGGFGAGSMTAAAQVSSQSQQHLLNPQGGAMQAQNFGDFGASGAMLNQSQASGSTGGGAPPQPKPRVRARRGQATDPHSIAERLRRERIAERMKALQELVPNANKTDKASMLDEIIDYVKFLQLQVKVPFFLFVYFFFFPFSSPI
uniref:Uncharacterized protein MANES_14G112400 n=1 Tax=Rhizophora mucronata TaxID=61149 RepID=A0A2P2L8J7_RHIMU